MTWREDWARDIHEATKALPPDTPLKERMKVVDAVKHQSPGAYSTSWGKKSWAAARRDYLVRFGYVPKTKQKDPAPAGLLDIMQEGDNPEYANNRKSPNRPGTQGRLEI